MNKKDKEGRNYWEHGDAVDRPFLIAVADFHDSGGDGETGSMVYTASALWPYLYGHRIEWELIDGQLVTARCAATTAPGGKVIETGASSTFRA